MLNNYYNNLIILWKSNYIPKSFPTNHLGTGKKINPIYN